MPRQRGNISIKWWADIQRANTQALTEFAVSGLIHAQPHAYRLREVDSRHHLDEVSRRPWRYTQTAIAAVANLLGPQKMYYTVGRRPNFMNLSIMQLCYSRLIYLSKHLLTETCRITTSTESTQENCANTFSNNQSPTVEHKREDGSI